MLRICGWIVLALVMGCARAEELTMQIAKDAEVPVKPALAGMGMQFVYEDQVLTAAEREELLELKIPVLRVPAGTQSMAFDWETGTFHGARQPNEASRKFAKVPLQEYFDIAERVGAQVAYVVNVYQDPPEKTKRLAQLVKDKGYPVRYWELGNEAASEHYADKFQDVGDYLAAAREHDAAIRSVFPDAQTALATMNRNFKTSPWNRGLAAQDEFQNIVVHRYVSPTGEREERREMARSGRQVGAATQLKRLLKHSKPDSLGYLQTFPGKHFWVTEWGMLYTRMDMQNSLAHALWMGRTFMVFLRHPEVDMATYFTLNAAPFELIDDQGGKVVHRVPFYVYQFMLRLTSEYRTTAPVRLGGAQGDAIVGQHFEGSGGRSAALFVNASGRARDVRVSDRERDLVVETLGANEPDATNGHSMAMTESLRTKTTEDVVPERSEQHGRTVKLPPYGVVLVEML